MLTAASSMAQAPLEPTAPGAAPAGVEPAPATPAAVAPAAVAPAEPRDPGSLAEGLSVSGGLTAADVGRRAAETSVEADVKRQRVIAAKATRERVFWDAAPHLTLTAQTTRVSPVDVFEIPIGDGDLTGPAFPPPPLTNH